MTEPAVQKIATVQPSKRANFLKPYFWAKNYTDRPT